MQGLASFRYGLAVLKRATCLSVSSREIPCASICRISFSWNKISAIPFTPSQLFSVIHTKMLWDHPQCQQKNQVCGVLGDRLIRPFLRNDLQFSMEFGKIVTIMVKLCMGSPVAVFN
jgi:hypothetical protein